MQAYIIIIIIIITKGKLRKPEYWEKHINLAQSLDQLGYAEKKNFENNLLA